MEGNIHPQGKLFPFYITKQLHHTVTFGAASDCPQRAEFNLLLVLRPTRAAFIRVIEEQLPTLVLL